MNALVHGAHLKSHRTVDGDKTYCLHRADGSVVRAVAMFDVAQLCDQGLLVGNMKFPAATYLLTDAGLRRATQDQPASLHPLTPR